MFWSRNNSGYTAHVYPRLTYSYTQSQTISYVTFYDINHAQDSSGTAVCMHACMHGQPNV